MVGRAEDGPLVMGVLNVTPDSFSDGGRYRDGAAALARGLEMVAEGADVIDVGGESSRPGATPVEQAEECRRVLPVIGPLAEAARVSIDTVKPAVAAAAVAEGATLVNDVSATLWPLAAELGVGWVAMHMQGTPADMQADPHYDDVVTEVHRFLLEQGRRAADAGVGEVWLDPGIGFGKTRAHNLALLAHLDELVRSADRRSQRVLVGASRKGFLGPFGTPGGAPPLGVEDRSEASLAAAVWALAQGASMVRVHDVAATVRASALGRPAREPAA